MRRFSLLAPSVVLAAAPWPTCAVCGVALRAERITVDGRTTCWKHAALPKVSLDFDGRWIVYDPNKPHPDPNADLRVLLRVIIAETEIR